MSLEEIELHAQNFIIILNSQLNCGDIYDHVMSTRFHFDNEEDIHMNSKIYEESNYGLNLDLLTITY